MNSLSLFLEEIHKNNTSPDSNSYERALLLAQQLITVLIKLRKGEVSSSRINAAHNVSRKKTQKSLVEKTILEMHDILEGKSLLNGQDFSLIKLARKVATNTTSLTRAFNEIENTSPMRYWKALCLKQAAQLLIESDLPITVIAIDCFYKSSAGFATTFRQHFRSTPSEYRRKHGKQST